jgi:hypothetical protein
MVIVKHSYLGENLSKNSEHCKLSLSDVETEAIVPRSVQNKRNSIRLAEDKQRFWLWDGITLSVALILITTKTHA